MRIREIRKLQRKEIEKETGVKDLRWSLIFSGRKVVYGNKVFHFKANHKIAFATVGGKKVTGNI